MNTKTGVLKMIILEISNQHRYTDGSRPYIVRNSENYSFSEWENILEYLKRNAGAGITNFIILED
jgi:hypothetical protein